MEDTKIKYCLYESGIVREGKPDTRDILKGEYATEKEAVRALEEIYQSDMPDWQQDLHFIEMRQYNPKYLRWEDEPTYGLNGHKYVWHFEEKDLI